MKIELDESIKTWSKYAKIYDPIKCASIDGTDSEPHDRAVVRALNSTYRPNRFVKGRPECTIFVSRLNHETSKDTIKDIFSKYGKLKRFRMVKDIVTGMPKGYAFVEYEEEQAAEEAYRLANRMVVDGNAIFVDFECERLLKDWKPRRLGGGFAGKKESGQLRFGGRDRPFKKPIALELKEQEDRRQRERRRKDDDRRLRDRSRERHRRRTPPREKGSRSPLRHESSLSKSKTSKRGLSPKDKEENGLPRKVLRHHSPTKQIDKTSKSSSREKNDLQGKKLVSSPDRKRERKNSPMQDSSRQENVKTFSSETAKQASSNKKHDDSKEIHSRGTTKQDSSSSNKPISKDRSTLTKSERGRSPIRRSPKQSSLERPIKCSPSRVKDRRHSPIQKTVQRSPQRETHKNRPTIIREKGRSSRSPILRNGDHNNSPSRADERRMYNGRHESPTRKQLKYYPERSNDRRRSPLQSYSQNGEGKIQARHSPPYVRQRFPQRGYHSPNRRSPQESFNRQYSPQDNSINHSEKIRSPIYQARENRGMSPTNNRSSKRSPREYFPKDHSSPRYEDKMRVSRYADSHVDQGYLYHSDLRTSEYLPSAQHDFKQYSPELDFREPPPSYKPVREYLNFKESNDGNSSNVFASSRSYPRTEDYSRHIDSLEDTRGPGRPLYPFRDNLSPRGSYNPISNSQDFYPENSNYLLPSYQNVRQHRDEASRYESKRPLNQNFPLADARNCSSRGGDDERFAHQRGKLRGDRGGFGQF